MKEKERLKKPINPERAERMRTFRNKLNLDKSKLARKMGVKAPTYIYSENAGSLSAKLEDAYKAAFPNLNLNWLRSGIGEMFTHSNPNLPQDYLEALDCGIYNKKPENNLGFGHNPDPLMI